MIEGVHHSAILDSFTMSVTRKLAFLDTQLAEPESTHGTTASFQAKIVGLELGLNLSASNVIQASHSVVLRSPTRNPTNGQHALHFLKFIHG